jgi:potassium-transporting ATPase ATP-binding subunit
MSQAKARSLFDPPIVKRALRDSLTKLNPLILVKNPVIFVVEVVSVMITVDAAVKIASGDSFGYALHVAAWLWFTVLFANFAEALAEGRGKAQADALRATRSESTGKRVLPDGATEIVPASQLRKGEEILVSAGELIPTDGEVLEGIASVDESAITGESAPVIREAGGDRSSVTGGTKVLSDWLRIRVVADPGETFLDKMIALVEQGKRQKTPNELALSIILTTFTIIFLIVILSLQPFAIYAGGRLDLIDLIALFVCLIPTTIGGLLSAIGIAGMDRMIQHNVIAMSGKAVEAAGDVSTMLLDKTGTITMGNRQAVAFIPGPGVVLDHFVEDAQIASLPDETPEGRSIVTLAKRDYGLRERDLLEHHAQFVPFSADTRMSGVDVDGRQIRKGAVDSVAEWCDAKLPSELREATDRIAGEGGTPLLLAVDRKPLGIIELRDILKEGMSERFDQLRRVGIRTVMITGDNPLTAKAIAKDAGVDDYLAEAKPQDKLDLIKKEQQGGRLVAMIGDGTNDAPALAQADVGVAMNAGTQAAKEAGNMVDLDSNPTKLLDVVEVGKQLLITRGSLTTFSIANDVAKYFAIIPAMFTPILPALDSLNVLGLSSPSSAVLSAVIFNALVILALIPLSLRGVRYKPMPASTMLRRNLGIYGLGGLVVPFIGIKFIDLLLGPVI